MVGKNREPVVPSDIPVFEQDAYYSAAKTILHSSQPQTEVDARGEVARIVSTYYRPALFKVARAAASGLSLAEDGLQVGLYHVFRGAHTFDYAAPILPWSVIVVQNATRGVLRKERQNTRIEVMNDGLLHRTPQPGRGEEERIVERDLMQRVLDALEQLPDHKAQALRLYGIADHDYREVGALLSIPVGTVRSRINRARHALRALLPESELREVLADS